jgi:acyl-coenzyme A thioesterase PaaI-like protein
MNIRTHQDASKTLIGKPVLIEDNRVVIELETIEAMVVDDRGLIHGGFTFGLADYAAMLSVNHPNVVLSSSEVKFISPVKRGETMTCHAKVTNSEKNRRRVIVKVLVQDRLVLEGHMNCVILDKHVLEL